MSCDTKPYHSIPCHAIPYHTSLATPTAGCCVYLFISRIRSESNRHTENLLPSNTVVLGMLFACDVMRVETNGKWVVLFCWGGWRRTRYLIQMQQLRFRTAKQKRRLCAAYKYMNGNRTVLFHRANTKKNREQKTEYRKQKTENRQQTGIIRTVLVVLLVFFYSSLKAWIGGSPFSFLFRFCLLSFQAGAGGGGDGAEELTEEEGREILEMKNSSNIYTDMVNSIAPTVFGHSEVRCDRCFRVCK